MERSASVRTYFEATESKKETGKKAVSMNIYCPCIISLALSVIFIAQIIGHTLWRQSDPGEDNKLLAPLFTRLWIDNYGREYDPTNQMYAYDFALYCTLFQWITVVICGLGGEIVFGFYLVSILPDNGARVIYMMAQMFFSLFMAIAFFSQAAYGLIFIVIGLWKGGFPETVGYFIKARNRGFGTSWWTAHSVSCFVNGMGTLLHHLSASYIMCGVIGRIFTPGRDLVATTLPG